MAVRQPLDDNDDGSTVAVTVTELVLVCDVCFWKLDETARKLSAENEGELDRSGKWDDLSTFEMKPPPPPPLLPFVCVSAVNNESLIPFMLSDEKFFSRNWLILCETPFLR